jgi:hypothetical protein
VRARRSKCRAVLAISPGSRSGRGCPGGRRRRGRQGWRRRQRTDNLDNDDNDDNGGDGDGNEGAHDCYPRLGGEPRVGDVVVARDPASWSRAGGR